MSSSTLDFSGAESFTFDWKLSGEDVIIFLLGRPQARDHVRIINSAFSTGDPESTIFSVSFKWLGSTTIHDLKISDLDNALYNECFLALDEWHFSDDHYIYD